MSIKNDISYSETYRFYHETLFDDEIQEVCLELTEPTLFVVDKQTANQQLTVTIGLSSEEMDQIAIAGIKERHLQGAVGGPIGNRIWQPGL
ncbi:MAG: hypothetical protein V7739_18860 [Motiliproteus sp.]